MAKQPSKVIVFSPAKDLAGAKLQSQPEPQLSVSFGVRFLDITDNGTHS
jgi:hypothetical protein